MLSSGVVCRKTGAVFNVLLFVISKDFAWLDGTPYGDYKNFESGKPDQESNSNTYLYAFKNNSSNIFNNLAQHEI